LIKQKCYSPYSNIKSVNVKNIDILFDTTIIDQKEKVILRKWMIDNVLKNSNGKKLSLSLLYRMSRDGREIDKAHSKYLNKGATLTLMQSRDYDHVCGGYDCNLE